MRGDYRSCVMSFPGALFMTEDTLFPCIRLTDTTGPYRRLARLLLWILLSVLLLLALTPWQQNIRGVGRVIAFAPEERQQTIEATVEGRIKAWSVREGTHVKAGARIGEIRDYDPTFQSRISHELALLGQRIDVAAARISAFESQEALASRSRVMAIEGAQHRIQMARERLKAAQHQREAARAARETARLNLDRQQVLETKGLASRRVLELARLESAQRVTDFDRAEAGLKGAESEVNALEADRQKQEADAGATLERVRTDLAKSRDELKNLETEKIRLETRQSRQATQILKAPRDGTILRLLVNPDAEVVKPGDAVAILVPSTAERAVELWVDGNDAPLIDRDRPVRLQFEGYPAVQFSGWPETAVGTFGGKVRLIDATDNGKGDFRVLIVPDPEDLPWPDDRFLRQGVRVNGWVLLNVVRLGYELWRQFNGFPPLMTAEGQESMGAKSP